MSKIKHLMSYLFPVIIDAQPGEISHHLEVRKSNGKLTLDSSTSNYSYGGAQKLFDALFTRINIKQYNFNKVLLLGMGAGNVIELLKEKHRKNCHITAIEKDAVVIELAKKYFNIQRFNSLLIIQEDAFRFAATDKDKYDLIIVDLFINDDVPEQFATPEFLSNLRKLASNDCCIIYNKMTDKPNHKKEFKNLLSDFEIFFPGLKVHKLVANNSENSFVYYNTLPATLPQIKTVEEPIKEEIIWPGLKPAFDYSKTKE